MATNDTRADDLRALINQSDNAAKRIFDTLARMTAVCVLVQLANATRNPWLYATASAAGVTFFAWLTIWFYLGRLEVMARKGFPDRSHNFPAAFSFTVQVLLIGLALWGLWTVTPEVMRALVATALAK